ncbi:MAG: CAP domain-containing protein [Actinomycetota bacterium]
MRTITRFFGLSIALGVMMTLLPLTTAVAADSGCWDTKRSERGFARKITVARRAAGRSRLSLDPELSRAARKHTFEMVRKDLLHHTSEPALRRRVTNWSTLGENVGVGGTVTSLHAAFMASPAHKDNILYKSFRHVGIGVVKRNGRMWVTVIFEAQTDPGTTLRMPRC